MLVHNDPAKKITVICPPLKLSILLFPFVKQLKKAKEESIGGYSPQGGSPSQREERNVEPLFPDGGFPVLQVGVAHGAVQVDYRVLNLFKGLEIEGALVDGIEGKSTDTYARCPVDE